MIIGLTGYAGAGKSTAAKILVERHGFTLVKFAGPLKQMLRCLGLGDHEIEGAQKEFPHHLLNGKSPRQAMQLLGTEWGRDLIGADLWVNVAMESAWTMIDRGGKVVLDDCRFENEAEAIRTEGGIIVEVMRPGIGPINNHSSEQLPKPDRLLWNSKDIAWLQMQVADIIKGDWK